MNNVQRTVDFPAILVRKSLQKYEKANIVFTSTILIPDLLTELADSRGT